jgi:pimeloyl-ACP methyl ester carboxylesterase
MGGRVCLVICELLAAQVDKVMLLAPDGLRFNYFYYFLTRTRVGRFLFSDFSKRSAAYKRWLSRIGNLRLISKSKYKFAMLQIRSAEAVNQLKNTWNSTNQLIPDLKQLQTRLALHPVPIHVIMGAYDKIIPLRLAQEFSKKNTGVHIHVVPRGHLLHEYKEVQQAACNYLFNTADNA